MLLLLLAVLLKVKPSFWLNCNSSFKAILDLSIIYNKPIGNGIITALNKKQAYQRSGKIKSKKPNKGVEAANAILSILKYGLKKIIRIHLE